MEAWAGGVCRVGLDSSIRELKVIFLAEKGGSPVKSNIKNEISSFGIYLRRMLSVCMAKSLMG